MTTFDSFMQEWLGKWVDYDHTYGKQCVDLIRQYFYECYGLSGGGGVPTAIAYWTNTPADVLTKFSKDGSGNVQKGDVVMLRTLGHTDYAGDGHIGIATGNGDPNSIEILEQNGLGSGTGLGGDAIRTRFIPRNRLAGVLRPIPAAPVEKFHVIETYPSGRQIRLNKQPTYLWGMNFDFNYMKDHPIEAHNAGEVWTVTNKVHHIDGYDYYRRDGQVDGFNVADCDDYTPPPIYVPPAPPVTATPAETYDVITKLMVFPSAADAKALSNYTGSDLEPGKYYVFAKDNNAFNLSTDNVKNENKWVRITDNVIKAVVEPVPEPVVPTLPVDPPPVHDEPTDISDNSLATAVTVKFQYAMIKPIIMESNVVAPEVFYDLEQPDKRPTVTLNVNSSVEFSMTATDPTNGDVYYIPTVSMKKGYRHGIPEHCLMTAHSHLDLNHNGRNDLLDIERYAVDDAYNWTKYLETGFKTAKVFITDVIKPETLQPVVERSKQFSKGVMDIVAKKKGK